MVVKGKTQPVGVYEVLDYHTDETFPNLMDVVNHFRDGRKLPRGNWDRAIRAFNECLKANPDDKLSKVYIERCELLKATPPADWDGVWRMTSKSSRDREALSPRAVGRRLNSAAARRSRPRDSWTGRFATRDGPSTPTACV